MQSIVPAVVCLSAAQVKSRERTKTTGVDWGRGVNDKS
jgi:hypothetical protein